MSVSLKTFLRLTWLPNVVLLACMVWILGGSQGWLSSIDRDNEQRLQQLEDHGTAVARENQRKIDELTAKIDAVDKDRKQRYKYWLRWADKVDAKLKDKQE